MNADRAPHSLTEQLCVALERHRDRVALIEMNRKREVFRATYREFAEYAAGFAETLDACGIGPGDRVAILMSNQSKWLIAAFGALRRGAVLVPIDYKLEPHEQRALLRYAAPKCLVVEAAHFAPLGETDVEHVFVSEAPDDVSLGSAKRFELTKGNTTKAAIARHRDDVAAIVFSSGTSGAPKACELTHANYLEQYRALSALYPMGSGDRYFSILPTNHAIDFMCGFIGPLSGGATVVHQRTLRPDFILDTMQQTKITHMAVVPMLLAAFERALRERIAALSPMKRAVFEALAATNQWLTRGSPNLLLSRTLLRPIHAAFGGSLKYLFCGGAFTDPERAQFFYRLGIPVVIGYGLTECCTVATVNDLKPFRADTVGRPVAGVRIRIDEPNADGVGEVLISGPTLMRRYTDPAQMLGVLEDGWLHTGDLGYIDDVGHLHLVGRCKNMIVTEGGKNIYPEDVETAFGDLPCEEYAVFSSEYVFQGQQRTSATLSSEQLLLTLRLRHTDEDHARSQLLDEVRARNNKLPPYKRIGAVVFTAEPFPRTASMKLKRDMLARKLRDSTPPPAIEPL